MYVDWLQNVGATLCVHINYYIISRGHILIPRDVFPLSIWPSMPTLKFKLFLHPFPSMPAMIFMYHQMFEHATPTPTTVPCDVTDACHVTTKLFWTALHSVIYEPATAEFTSGWWTDWVRFIVCQWSE